LPLYNPPKADSLRRKTKKNNKRVSPPYNPQKSKRKEQRLKKQINKNYWWENIHQYAEKKAVCDARLRKLKKTKEIKAIEKDKVFLYA